MAHGVCPFPFPDPSPLFPIPCSLLPPLVMKKPRNKYVDYVQYVAIRLFAMLVHMFPWRANYRTAKWLADMMFRFDKRHRDRALRHLELSFPDWPPRKRWRVARASVRNLVYLGVEFLFTTRLMTPATWRLHMRLHDLGETIRILLERKSGAIFVTGHFGNWEVIGYAMATMGFPSVSIARRLDNPYVDEYAFGVRGRTGQMVLDKKGATRTVPEVLERRGAVAFVADQDAGRKGAFVDFFGRKASTYKIIALMAMRYEAPIIVGYGKRLAEEFKFEMGIQRIIRPHEWADKDDPVMWITQEFTRALEDVIRSAPEQYLWVHRRWKHRPKGEPQPADGIA